MRRGNVRWALRFLLFALFVSLSATVSFAQQGPINPRLPPPPPPPEEPPKPAPPPARAPESPEATKPADAVAKPAELPPIPEPPADLPERMSIAGGTRLGVVLDTPLSTRIAKKGQQVNFRTTEPVPIYNDLMLPPETMISGTVVEAQRPGGFGKAGMLRIKIERISLATGAESPLEAHLDSQDMDGKGRLHTDKQHTTDLYNLISYAAQGTLLGASIKGGKGAAVGAGAGAAIALILMASKRGPDLYLEPGMPFQVIVDQPVELPGRDVFRAHHEYQRTLAAHDNSPSASRTESTDDKDSTDPGRPKLKRRRPPQD